MRRRLVVALAVALCGACVAFDPNEPVGRPVAGRYASVITIHYQTEFEHWWDTLTATVTLGEARPHGRFAGSYLTAAGDAGVVGGSLQPGGTIMVTEFSQPPLTTLQGATFLHRLYPWCDFRTIGTGALPGRISGDTLVIEGRGSVVCRYQAWGRDIGIGANLDFLLVGVR